MHDILGAGMLREWVVLGTAEFLALSTVIAMIFAAGARVRSPALIGVRPRRRLPAAGRGGAT
jgi:hypothetical protein